MIQFARAESLAGTFGTAIDAALTAGPRTNHGMQAAHELLAELQLCFGESGGAPVELRMQMSLFVHGTRTLAMGSIRGRSGITFLRIAGIGGVSFEPVIDVEAVVKLLEIAASIIQQGEVAQSAWTPAQSIDAIVGVSALAPTDDMRWSLVSQNVTTSAYQGAGIDTQIVEPAKLEVATAIEESVALAAAENAVDLDRARAASEQILDAASEGFANVLHVAERPEFDVFTVQHSLRVSLLTTYVATVLGVDRDTLIELTAAAMFHDVGKGRVPDEVLYKPGRLDGDEARAMQLHPSLGAEILLDSNNVSPYALGAAWGHHVRFDGRGYPETRPWFKPTRATSLIQICDVYEALTARRPYKPPYSPARAYQILYSDPGAFDPAMLSAFTRAMGLYPPGRFVALSDGRLARVAAAGAALDRPLVRLFPDGEFVDLGQPQSAHLSVVELIDEPELVRRLHGGPELAEEIAEEKAEAEACGPRDEEFVELTLPPYADEEACGHGADCRLC